MLEPTPQPRPPQRDLVALVTFFTLALGVSWTLWFGGLEDGEIARVNLAYGTWGPAIAMLCTATFAWGPRETGRQLLRAFTPELKVTPIFFFLTLCVGTSFIVGDRADPMAALAEVETWWQGLRVVIGSTLWGGAMGEELGWRLFALPMLLGVTTRHRAIVALGLVWGLWHLPLVWATSSTVAAVVGGMLFFLIKCVGLSYLFAGVHLRTTGSLWPVLFLHAAFDASTGGLAHGLLLGGGLGVWAWLHVGEEGLIPEHPGVVHERKH